MRLTTIRPGVGTAVLTRVAAALLFAATLGGLAVADVSNAPAASAAVDNGRRYTGFPATMRIWINYWSYRNWPTTRSSFTEVDPGNTTRRLRVIGGLRYSDSDRQLTNWIRSTFPEAQTPMFFEYDMRFREEHVHGMGSRGEQRIVRDAVNGLVFYTDNHYTDFHLWSLGENWPNEDVQDRTPPPPPPPPAATAWISPTDADVRGESRYVLNGPSAVIPSNAGTRNASYFENRVASRTDADDVGDFESSDRYNFQREVMCAFAGSCPFPRH